VVSPFLIQRGTLERYLDGIMIRTFDQEDVDELARYASDSSDQRADGYVHPTQVVADLMTVEEHLGKLDGLKLAYIGDGNNVAHSLLQICAKMGLHMTIACPRGMSLIAKPYKRPEMMQPSPVCSCR